MRFPAVILGAMVFAGLTHTACGGQAVPPWDKYYIAEPTLWNEPPLPLPDLSRDTIYCGANPAWFMENDNGLKMTREIKRLFPDTQFVLSAVFVPPRTFPAFLKKLYAEGGFFQSQKAPVLDADALVQAGLAPIGDNGKPVKVENWVIATTPNYQDFYKRKLFNTAKLGVNNFKQVDFVWPWDARYPYDDISVRELRKDLAGKDEGLRIIRPDGNLAVIHFSDYYEHYRGVRLTPAELGLQNWEQYKPTTEAEANKIDAPLTVKRNLVAFFLLYHYEHLKQYQRFGDWAKEASGGIHEATVNPESLYNAVDNIFITRLASFGTLYYEYFGSPLNSEAAYLHMPGYRRNAIACGKKLGLIKELGQGGHGRPHNTAVIEFLHNLDLTANGFDFYQNEWADESSFDDMLRPEKAYLNNRWNVYLGGAYGYLLAREQKGTRSMPQVLSVANRSGGFYASYGVWDASTPNSFGAALLADHVDLEESYPGQLAELLKHYRLVFYTPSATRPTDVPLLNRWLAEGGKTVITHSSVPYALDMGIDFITFGESTAEYLRQYAACRQQGNWALAPEFKALKLEPGPFAGTVFFGEDETPVAKGVTIPDYWIWHPEGAVTLARLGGKPLISMLQDRHGNKLVYWHVLPTGLPPEVASQLTSRLVKYLELPRLATGDAANPVLLHAYKLGQAPGDLVVLYDRKIMMRDGALLGYRPESELRKRLFQYVAPGAAGKASYTVATPGKYLVYQLIADHLETVQVLPGQGLGLALKDVFADAFYVGLDTPEWQAFIETLRRKRATIMKNIGYQSYSVPLPGDWLFSNQ